MMVRDERWKYVEFPDASPLLFDLVNDPDELHNLADDPPPEAPLDHLRAAPPPERHLGGDGQSTCRRSGTHARTLKRTPQREHSFNIAFQTGGSSTRMPLSTKPGRSLSDFAAHKAPSI